MMIELYIEIYQSLEVNFNRGELCMGCIFNNIEFYAGPKSVGAPDNKPVKQSVDIFIAYDIKPFSHI